MLFEGYECENYDPTGSYTVDRTTGASVASDEAGDGAGMGNRNSTGYPNAVETTFWQSDAADD